VFFEKINLGRKTCDEWGGYHPIGWGPNKIKEEEEKAS
jgi:hypothetical protein